MSLRFPPSIRRGRVAGACLALALAAQAFAQAPPPNLDLPPSTDPGALQQRRIEEQRRQLQEEELRREPIDEPIDTDALPQKQAPAIREELYFELREIEFTPSEMLTRAQLEALAAPYRGRRVSLQEIQQLVTQVNALYREQGIVTARAVLPAQDLSDGSLRIRLIEGRLGELSVRENRSTDEDYVAAWVRQQPGEVVDLPALERDLRRFNRTNDAQARAELRPGADPGETDIGIILVEPRRHELTVFSDNGGSEATGELRWGATYRNRSLFGWRDDLGLSAIRAAGQESYSIGYGTPINTLGTRVRVAYYDDRTEITDGPFAGFNINGDASALVGTLRHPLLFGADYQVDALVGAKRRNSRNRFDIVPLQDTDTEDMSLGLEAQRADSGGYWLASITAAKVRSQPMDTDARRFGIWRGSLRRSQNLAEGYAAVGSVNWQYTADDRLPPSEQFLLGGDYSVRGYSTGVLAGDRGYTVNLELHHPLPLWSAASPSGFLFLDYGQVRTSGDPQGTADTLMGVGWGISMALPGNFALRASYASAQRHLPEEDHYRVMFQLFWTVSADRLQLQAPELLGRAPPAR